LLRKNNIFYAENFAIVSNKLKIVITYRKNHFPKNYI